MELKFNLKKSILLLFLLNCIESQAQYTPQIEFDTLPKYEKWLMQQMLSLPIKNMDSVFQSLNVFGGSSVNSSKVRWSIDNHFDKCQKVGKYKVLSRYDSTGHLQVKKYTKPWYISKNKGRIFPFQIFPVNNTFWFMAEWEKNEFRDHIFIGGILAPPVEPYLFFKKCLIIQDSISRYYFLFTDYTNYNTCRDGTSMNCYKLSCYSSIYVLDGKLNPVVYITQALNCTDAHVVTLQKDGLYDARLGLNWAEIKANTLKDLAVLIKKIPKKPLPNSKVHDNDVYRMEFSSWGQRIRNDFDWINYKKKT